MGVLTTAEVARRLNQDPNFARGAIAALRIKTAKIGPAWVIDEADFEKLSFLARSAIFPRKRKTLAAAS